MKSLETYIKEVKLSESLAEIDSDSIAYSTDVWFRNNDDLKDEFYKVVDIFNTNGIVPDENLLKDIASKIDLRNFVDFVLGDAKTSLDNDTIDYMHIFKKIIQTTKRS